MASDRDSHAVFRNSHVFQNSNVSSKKKESQELSSYKSFHAGKRWKVVSDEAAIPRLRSKALRFSTVPSDKSAFSLLNDVPVTSSPSLYFDNIDYDGSDWHDLDYDLDCI